MRILLTGIGGPAGICFAKSLSLNEIEDIILGADGGEGKYGKELVSSFYKIPMANDPTYLDKLNELIDKEKINYLIPLVDEELPIISFNQNKIHCRVLISPYETIKYTTDKIKIYEKLDKYLPRRIPYDNLEFPLFVKPRIGRGAKDVHLIETKEDLSQYDPNKYIYQEVLLQPEITVDSLFDNNGKLLIEVQRVREVVEEAICIKGRIIKDKEISTVIKEISNIFKFIGPINFQFMKSEKERYKLTEINARSSGGMGITVNSGVNIPYIIINLLRKYHFNEMNYQIQLPNISTGVFDNFSEIIERQKEKMKAKIR